MPSVVYSQQSIELQDVSKEPQVPRSYVRHMWLMLLTPHIWHWDMFRCDMTPSYVTRLISMWDMHHSYVIRFIRMWHDPFICHTPHLYAWHGMTPSYVTWLISYATWRDQICAMTRSYLWHNSVICVPWLTHVCDMTRSDVWYDSIICVTWLDHISTMTWSCLWHDSIRCVTWLNHMCGIAWSYLYHDSIISVTWLNHICSLTQSRMWHNSIRYVPWFDHLCDMTRSYVCHDLIIHVPWLVHVRDMTRWYVWHDAVLCVTCHVSQYRWSWGYQWWQGGSALIPKRIKSNVSTWRRPSVKFWYIHCNTLQHNATHCHTLQHTLRHTATCCNALQRTFFDVEEAVRNVLLFMYIWTRVHALLNLFAWKCVCIHMSIYVCVYVCHEADVTYIYQKILALSCWQELKWIHAWS